MNQRCIAVVIEVVRICACRDQHPRNLELAFVDREAQQLLLGIVQLRRIPAMAYRLSEPWPHTANYF